MKIIVMTGIPASGKTLFYNLKLNSYKRISLSELKSRKQEMKAILTAINNEESIVIDNTNTTIEERSKYIELAKIYDCEIISCYVVCNKEVALKRNSDRIDKPMIPDAVVHKMNNRLIVPSKDEGFDKLYVVDSRKEGFKIYQRGNMYEKN